MASRRKRTLSASVRVAEALASAKPKDALRTLFETEVDELRKMEDEGVIAKGTSTDAHPIRTIIRLEFTPSVPPVLQFACAKERLQYHELTAGEKARLNALGDGSPVKIEVSIAQWAAAKPVLPALSAPDETVIEPDMPRTNGSPPTPPMSDRERLRAQVHAQRETVIVEAPVSPSEPAHVIGRVTQGRSYELSEDEKQRIMERLRGQ